MKIVIVFLLILSSCIRSEKKVCFKADELMEFWNDAYMKGHYRTKIYWDDHAKIEFKKDSVSCSCIYTGFDAVRFIDSTNMHKKITYILK